MLSVLANFRRRSAPAWTRRSSEIPAADLSKAPNNSKPRSVEQLLTELAALYRTPSSDRLNGFGE